MKTLLFAAALTISGVAVAQSTTTNSQPTTTQPSGETVDDPSQSTGPRGVTQQGTVPDGQTRAAGDYPPCSRTVTDSCVQTYERGVRGSRPRR